MTKNTSASANLLLLSHLYEAQANRFLRKWAQKTPLTERLINSNLQGFLMLYFHAKPENVENWAHVNETVLTKYHFNWQHDLHRLIAENEKRRRFSIVEYAGEDPNWQSEAFLQGSGPIRALTIRKYVGSFGRESSETYSSKIGHFGFLVPAFSQILRRHGEELTEIVERFVAQNIEQLNKMRTSFESEPRELGGGVDGVAYSIGSNRVLKIFHLPMAYTAALEAMHRLWKVPQAAGTEAMIYEAKEFEYPALIKDPFEGTTKQVPIYYYIMEKMIPIDDIVSIPVADHLCGSLREIANAHVDVSGFKAMLRDPGKMDRLRKEVRKNAKMVEGKMRSENPETVKQVEEAAEKYNLKLTPNTQSRRLSNLRPDWLTRLCEEVIWKHITGRVDLHGANLGLTPYGTFRYFDPKDARTT